MKTAILGAGAMGALIGSNLHKGGAEVWLVDPFEAHMNKIRNEGLKMYVNENGQKREESVVMNAVTKAEDVGVCEVVIVLVKGMYTASAVEGARALFDDDTLILTFQNGIGNADTLAEIFAPERIGFGVLNLASVLKGPGEIFVNYSTNTPNSNIYFYSNSPVQEKKCLVMRDIIRRGGFLCEYTDRAEEFIWQKLIINAFVNLTCGLTRLTMGQFFDQEDGRALQQGILKELIAVAGAKGIEMDYDQEWQKWEKTMAPLSPSRDHYPSATQDVFNCRKTEADFLNGAICREGRKRGIATPINDTIVQLAHVLENTYDLQYGR